MVDPKIVKPKRQLGYGQVHEGFYASLTPGNLVSVFFITQFFTSLLWSGIADRHGRRAVLVASMAGSAIALLIFGTSESLPEAICVRLVQGIFGGAVGVFRGSIRDITDDTNATRAYAVLGFSWGFGGVMGPILGGVFESPAENFRGSLGRIALFSSFPYLLPTLLGACILIVGATMACFLSWDGGVRGGSRIALAVEKDEPLAPRSPAPSTVIGHAEPPSPIDESPGPSANTPNPRRESLASLGTAYGYGGIRSKHPTLAARAALESARRVSAAAPREDDEEVEELNFAKKLLLANEENTFNINDLWVSAAVAQDTAVFDEDEDETPAPTPGSHAEGSARRMTRNRIASGPFYRSLPSHRLSTSQNRRFSTSSGTLPAIFGNTGLNTPPAATDDPFMSPGLGVINEAPDLSEEAAKPSTLKSLPLMMIVQVRISLAELMLVWSRRPPQHHTRSDFSFFPGHALPLWWCRTQPCQLFPANCINVSLPVVVPILAVSPPWPPSWTLYAFANVPLGLLFVYSSILGVAAGALDCVSRLFGWRDCHDSHYLDHVGCNYSWLTLAPCDIVAVLSPTPRSWC
ncbi:hypothetical protein BCR39DRAFT_519516 [Naematelia encephala]|uniref:Major facilitator superfamily domain-containing protein n=1 Tax=Naematelia encephala TaxID=71784 RepID=A0A1Y2BF15_9TREE|nr:hypothetical protein BCR39DRAFT_519516 [Naematelia encephala]